MNQARNDKTPKKIFLLLWLLCILGSWSVIPYIQYLDILPTSTSIQQILLLGTIQAAILYGLICFISYKLLPKTDLRPFPERNNLKKNILFGIIPGIFSGFAIYLLDKTIFSSSLLSTGKIHPPFWAGAIASLYGAINEEVLCRLFLFTLIYFLFQKIFSSMKRHRISFLWTTNVIVALIFGIGHLPAAFKLIEPTSYEISRILLLNGIPGIVFGWLYWSRGLWSAMIAHFMADLIIHVFL
ncbi:MAG: CPBP family intramembrane metalloprotease [Chlamydiia bacterium]|nr:CPBP family intramembrane metalloprotease [Chlamydiia bacterium]